MGEERHLEINLPIEDRKREDSRTKMSEKRTEKREGERNFARERKKDRTKKTRTNERKRAKSYDTEISNLICRYQRYL